MKLLALVTDAYGGRGGIAKFNRDLLGALASYPGVTDVEAFPRVVVEAVEGVPSGVTFHAETAGSKARYVRALAARLVRGQYDGVICGHLNLLPIGALAALRARVPLVLIAHGVEAWEPARGRFGRALQGLGPRRVDALVTVSQFTQDRMLRWLPLPRASRHVVPNCINVAPFGPGPARPDLLARYGLAGRRVVLTVGRLSSAEQYKGFDEVMEAFPTLLQEVPDAAYLICGDGDDRPRLEAKARALGLEDRVVFAGYIPEAEKADHYRLADCFAMPGRGEGFGIVYLEALACGIPVIASSADASQEAVLGGRLGAVVDPDDQEALVTALRDALAAPKAVPERLAYFSTERFVQRWHDVLRAVFEKPAGRARHPYPAPAVSAPA